MFSPYRALLARAGAPTLTVACALGWLAFGGYSLAVILLVRTASDSFADAGGAVALFAAGSGLAAPLRGRLVDRRGPRGLVVFGLGHAAASALLIATCAVHAGAVPALLSAALSGVLVPPLIATARAVWVDVAGELVATAHALNATLGDVGLLAGPSLAGGIAAVASPAAAFGALAALSSLTAIAVAYRHPGQRSSPLACSPRHRRWLLRESAGLRTAMVAEIGLGLALGAVEVAAVAVYTHANATKWSFVPLSASAVGSMAASLWSGTGRLRWSAGRRFIVAYWIIAGALVLTLVINTVVGISIVLAGVGVGAGLLAVALYELLDAVTPTGRAVEAFTWLTTGQGIGIALGAALGGLFATTTTRPFILASVTTIVTALAVSRMASTLRPVS